MDQHPVPQNISSYEFRLVGDMTLKQFFQLAGGVMAAVIIYKLPLPGLIKWPFMALATLTGVMLAFIPVSGRPFSQWIMAFIQAIYSPTEFHRSSQTSTIEPQVPTSSLQSPASKRTPLDLIEDQLFTRFSQIFQHPNLAFSAITPNVAPPPPSIVKPQVPASNIQPLPSNPNLLTGQVIDAGGKSLEGVILELVDATGLPVRALRSNKLGQFMTATPLPTGSYTLTAEKEGLQFSPLTLTFNNQVINPIVIKAS